MDLTLLNSAQLLWMAVAMQLAIYSAMWLIPAVARPGMRRGLLMVSLFNGAFALGIVLGSLRPVLMGEVSRSGGNLVNLVGFTALWLGLRHLFWNQRSLRWPLTVLAVGVTAVVVLGWVLGLGDFRVCAMLATIAVILSCITVSAFQSLRRRGETLTAWAVVLLVSPAMIWIGVRVVGTLVAGWPIELRMMDGHSLAFVYFSMASVCAINPLVAAVLLRRVLEEVETRSQRDPLTNLYNRRVFMDRLALQWERWQRGRGPFALAIIDIDHFKRVNDTRGHPEGDRVLRLTAQTLASLVRPFDTLARFGGEEFVILLDLGREDVDPLLLGERLREGVAAMQPWPNEPGARITVSIGMSRVCDGTGETDGEWLLKRADDALYRAKHGGRNRVVIDDAAPAVASQPDNAQAKVAAPA